MYPLIPTIMLSKNSRRVVVDIIPEKGSYRWVPVDSQFKRLVPLTPFSSWEEARKDIVAKFDLFFEQ